VTGTNSRIPVAGISYHDWRRSEGQGFSPAEIAAAVFVLSRAPRSLLGKLRGARDREMISTAFERRG